MVLLGNLGLVLRALQLELLAILRLLRELVLAIGKLLRQLALVQLVAALLPRFLLIRLFHLLLQVKYFLMLLTNEAIFLL